MAIQLKEAEYQLIKKILTTYLPQAKFYVFGSRARGTAKKYSDVDILMVTDKVVPLTTLALIKAAFDDSTLLFKVDLIDWHRITPEFRAKIQQEWMPLSD